MKTQPTLKNIVTATVATAAAAASLTMSAAAVAETLPYERELGSCVDAIYRHIELDDAVKVRHIVSESERDARGYELKIDTIVYRSGSTERFAAVCLARGTLKPFRLEIDGKTV